MEEEIIEVTCNGCSNHENVNSWSEIKYHNWHRSDAYGLSTGIWCDECYESSKYPYRKDRYYDLSYCGERMDDGY